MSRDPAAESVFETDVLILGGGPAGCAAALSLLKYSSLKVTVIERSAYADDRFGEVVSSAIVPLLDYLSAKDSFLKDNHLSSFESTSYWGAARPVMRHSPYTAFGEGWHLNRRIFDSTLAREAEACGGNVMRGTKVVFAELAPDGCWWVKTQHTSGAAHLIKSRFIIDASGKKSMLARKLGVGYNQLDQLVGVSCFFDLEPGAAAHSLVIETCRYGWWYSALLPNNRVVVSLMSDADIIRVLKLNRPENWQSLLKLSKNTFRRTDGKKPGSRLFVRPAHSQLTQCFSGNNWLATGDAVASFDPISSLGIGHAISSGIESGRVVNELLNGGKTLLDNYCLTIINTFKDYLLRQQQCYTYEQRWASQVFWQRRHAYAQGVR